MWKYIKGSKYLTKIFISAFSCHVIYEYGFMPKNSGNNNQTIENKVHMFIKYKIFEVVLYFSI